MLVVPLPRNSPEGGTLHRKQSTVLPAALDSFDSDIPSPQPPRCAGRGGIPVKVKARLFCLAGKTQEAFEATNGVSTATLKYSSALKMEIHGKIIITYYTFFSVLSAQDLRC